MNDLPNSSGFGRTHSAPRAPRNADQRASETVVRHSFPRAARLLRRADFDRVYEKGRRQLGAHLTLFWLAREAGGPRVGLTVGRALGGAVERNRIKRRLREAVRLHYATLPPALDLVLNPRKSALRLAFKDLCEDVSRAFEAVRKRSGDRRSG